MLPATKSQGEGYREQLTQWRQKTVASLPKIQQITQQLVLAILAGLLFDWLNIPVGWLLGPMIIGIVYATIQGNPQPLPPVFMTLGKATIGLATAVRFSPETLSMALNYAIPILLCVLLTGCLSLFHGYLLSRLAGIDRVTGLLAFIPGAASTIVAIGDEMGADAIAVAVLQYLRVLLVVLVIPSLAGFILPAHPVTQATTSIAINNHLPMPIFFNLLVLAGCCGLGIWGGNRLRLPASGLLGPMLVTLVAFWELPYQLQVPQWLFATGLLFVGVSIGLKFNRQAAQKLLKAVLIEVGLILVLILLCLGVGYEFHVVTQVDTTTAVLGFTPGGIEAMIATVMQLGGDAGLVLAMQMCRMLMIIVIAPWLVAFLIKTGKSSDGEEVGEEESQKLA
ncbi:MAG: AbrB family transcriptional regulator [Symploca sp. SIO2D2]|nr:AbrB family transcriptional regulator [Symploca sp. SIO2D2]